MLRFISQERKSGKLLKSPIEFWKSVYFDNARVWACSQQKKSTFLQVGNFKYTIQVHTSHRNKNNCVLRECWLHLDCTLPWQWITVSVILRDANVWEISCAKKQESKSYEEETIIKLESDGEIFLFFVQKYHLAYTYCIWQSSSKYLSVCQLLLRIIFYDFVCGDTTCDWIIWEIVNN